MLEKRHTSSLNIFRILTCLVACTFLYSLFAFHWKQITDDRSNFEENYNFRPANANPIKPTENNAKAQPETVPRDWDPSIVEALSASQRHRLSQIMTSPNDVELVIVRSGEDITWSNIYSSVRSVYDVNKEPYQYSLLFHVVNNYESLARVTVFSRGSMSQNKFARFQSGGEHLFNDFTIHDLMLQTHTRFIFSGAMWLPTAAQVVRKGFTSLVSLAEEAASQCPVTPLSSVSGREDRFGLNDKLLQKIAQLCQKKRFSHCSASEFWDEFIRLDRPPHDVVFFSHVPMFAVTSEDIRKRPLKQYRALLELMSGEADPVVAYFLDWFWYYVFTSNETPCNVTGSEFTWAMNLPMSEHLDFVAREKMKNLKAPIVIPNLPGWNLD